MIVFLPENRRERQLHFIYDHFSDHEHARLLAPDMATYSGLKVAIPQSGEIYHKAKLQESDGIEQMGRGGSTAQEALFFDSSFSF